MERVGRIELPSMRWQRTVIAVIRYPLTSGGADGTRTRDHRRDRPVF